MNKQMQSTDSINYQQSIAYTYNERGWLLSSSAPLFAMQLYYNTGTNKAWNGNIMYQYWGTPGSLTKNYSYAYDALNRLNSGTGSTGNTESGITYDLMGNITALKRYQASTLIDQMAYTYSGTNQLQSILENSGSTSSTGMVGGTTTYSYDGNGNLKSNTNTVTTTQNKSYTYNLLNLPLVVTIPTGTVTYTYDASGQKLRKVTVISGVTKTTDYISGIEYDNSTTAIGFIQTEEGKAAPISGGYDYTYYLGDNLGNTRITFDTKTGAAVSQQQDDYYPFGLELPSLVTFPKNEYLYNKKELQEELAQYDYGARFYDPVIARWTTLDPLAELGRRWSPYNYVTNNPIRNIDPDGMWTATADGVTTSDPAEITAFFGPIVHVKEKEDDKKQDHKGDHPVPEEYKQKGLPGFLGSQRLKKKKSARETWDLGGSMPLPELKKPEKDRKKIPKGWTGEWDRQHGEVEVYDKQGNHQGAWDPESGEENKGKQRADRKPTYNRFSSEEPDAQAMPVVGSAGGVSPGLVQKIQTVTGLSGAALWLYILVSEGSRLFPPRNIVPIP